MMTRREKLLMRPWQLRRYNNHKKKVLNAVPAVDFGPPPQRNHVTVKLKKLQQERERQSKIEEDNFKLLQHLGSIMTSKRVDNYWVKEPPNFLRRVCIYHRTRTPTPCTELTPASVSLPEENHTKKLRCLACGPQPEKLVLLPEERVPWEPPKKILTRRMSKSSVCPVLSDFDVKNKGPAPGKGNAIVSKKKISALPVIRENRVAERSRQSVTLRQGHIQVVVNFPTFAEIEVVRGKTNLLDNDHSQCKTLKIEKPDDVASISNAA